MAVLKTDYVDDVLNTSVNTQRKYIQTNNADGTISLTDATSYTQEGSTFGAADVNATNQEVNMLNENLAHKTNAISGTYDEGSFVTVDSIGYDKENKKLCLKVEGADTVIPFSGSDYIYLIKDGVIQTNTGINFSTSGFTQQDGYLKPTSSSTASGMVNIPELDMTKYECAVVDMSSTSTSSVTYILWYSNNTNDSTASRLSFKERGYTGTRDIKLACRDNTCRLYNLYLIPV